MDTGPGVHSFLRYCAKTTLACFCILNMFALCWCVLVCVWMQWVPLMSLDSSGPWRVTSWCMDGFVVLSLFYLFFLPKSQICVCLKDFYAIIMLLLTHIHTHKTGIIKHTETHTLTQLQLCLHEWMTLYMFVTFLHVSG